MTRIEEIAARLSKATPGPWRSIVETEPIGDGTFMEVKSVCFTGGDHAEDCPLTNPHCHSCIASEAGVADGEFIAHAREDIPYLLARLQSAEDVIRAAKKLMDSSVWLEIPDAEGGDVYPLGSVMLFTPASNKP